jgi:hypothetical protein
LSLNHIYEVLRIDGFNYTVLYWLAVPWLLFLELLRCGDPVEIPFGYLWLPKEERSIIKSCTYFSQDLGTCSKKNKMCFILTTRWEGKKRND